jgi:hypothetical protein
MKLIAVFGNILQKSLTTKIKMYIGPSNSLWFKAFSYRLLIRELRSPVKACGIVLGKEALYRIILEQCLMDLLFHFASILYPHITNHRRFLAVAINSVLQ